MSLKHRRKLHRTLFFHAVLLLLGCSVAARQPQGTALSSSESSDLVQDANGNILSLSCLRANAETIQVQGRKAALKCRTGQLQLSYPISKSY